MDMKQAKAVATSALETFAGVVAAQYSMGERDIKILIIGGIAGVIVPALRAMNPKDPAFGMVADVVTQQVDKLAKADRKKKTAK